MLCFRHRVVRKEGQFRFSSNKENRVHERGTVLLDAERNQE